MGRPQIFDEDEVITKALDIFWANGFHGTSTRDIIDGTGLSNGSFFNSFTDKNKMYLKCLQKYMDIYMTKLEQLLLSGDPFKEKMENLLQYTVRKDTRSGRYKGCFHFNTVLDQAIDDEKILKLTSEISGKIEDSVKKAVDTARKNNELSTSVKSITIAQYIITIISGLRVLIKENPSPSKLSNVIATVLDNLPIK